MNSNVVGFAQKCLKWHCQCRGNSRIHFERIWPGTGQTQPISVMSHVFDKTRTNSIKFEEIRTNSIHFKEILINLRKFGMIREYSKDLGSGSKRHWNNCRSYEICFEQILRHNIGGTRLFSSEIGYFRAYSREIDKIRKNSSSFGYNRIHTKMLKIVVALLQKF